MRFNRFYTGLAVLTAVMSVPIHVDGSPEQGLVNVSVACLRAEPRHGSELVSQAVMGTPMLLLEEAGGWWKVQAPDGYEAYVIDNSLMVCDSAHISRWRSAPRVVVTSPVQAVITDAHGRPVSDVVNGCLLELDGELNKSDGVCAVSLPDGRSGFISTSDLSSIEQWACQPYDPMAVIAEGEALMGIPYLWGGMSTKAIDCSGYVRVCFFANGRMLPRDASPQSGAGKEIPVSELKSGDLLFFGDRETGRINHVAISTGGHGFLHCSGRVMRGSLDPASADYSSALELVKAVRPEPGAYGSRGVVSVLDHPWYFNRSPVR